jgi:restriction endonuclease S subunit
MSVKSHGGAKPNWNGSMIKNIEIAISPLEEQRRLVAYLDGLQAQMSQLRLRQEETQKELDALMPSHSG